VADFGVYWLDYDADCYGPTRPLLRYETNSVRLLGRVAGDRLWFFVPNYTNRKPGHITVRLAQVFRVQAVCDVEEVDGEPPDPYPREVRADPAAWAWLDPFAPVARVVGGNCQGGGGEWQDVEVPIGSLLRGPRRLTTEAVRGLFDLLGPGAQERLRAEEAT
jgi:hypothetical protein